MNDCDWLRHEVGSARWLKRHDARQARAERVSRVVGTVLHRRGGGPPSNGELRPDGDSAGAR